MHKLFRPAAVVLLTAGGAWAGWSVARDWSPPPTSSGSARGAAPEGATDTPWDIVAEAAPVSGTSAELERRVERFCADCHALPDPAHLPARRWRQAVQQGYDYYAASGRQDLQPPTLEETLRYYLARAPETPTFAPPAEAETPLGTSFRVQRRTAPAGATMPEIANLNWIPLTDGGQRRLVACDLQYGQIVALDPVDPSAPPQILTRLDHPAHLQPCQLSGDGATELLVADLGSYKPADHDRGRVVLLRRPPGEAAFEEIELATGLGRVADARAADIDRDGRQDFIVAEFGWNDTGGIWLFHNTSTEDDPLQFTRRRLDLRPGTIHVPIHDFNEDGYPDFAALVSQDFESAELFFNATKRQPLMGSRRSPAFDRYSVWSAPDLTFGASGLRITDLNGDGRHDLLLTSGDAFDTNYASPLHGVHWLENRSDLQFEYHRLAHLPGAYAAEAVDVDRDGDQDVIAVSWLPPKVDPQWLRSGQPASVVLMEQTRPGEFIRHTLEKGSAYYASIAVGDFDDDGDADFAVGSGPMVAEDRSDGCYLSIWWNEPPAP